ncbi:MAG: tRNA (adenosine(37)-N6)-threonylcarbamoyltransferase complex ATPase subunit type 1 TsaE [Bacteroidales bacterium]|nr:tRNA (adenosine(37)-N6)-threonylcarbamoyltransferase complex ATPase subunit type 1 TsaE [Candidatus Physcousia equi]
MTTIKINDLNALPEAALPFFDAIGNRRVIAFYGKMGAGKTTFISALCNLLQVEDAVASPTFAIVNEYQAASDLHVDDQTERLAAFAGKPIFHFDFYRIRCLDEAKDIGIDDYFYSGNLCLIEWPELIEPLLPDDTVTVHLTEESDGTRTLTIDAQ